MRTKEQKALDHIDRALGHLNTAADLLGGEWDDYFYDSIANARALLREWGGWETRDRTKTQPR